MICNCIYIYIVVVLKIWDYRLVCRTTLVYFMVLVIEFQLR
jgi:hypothetical protein